MATDWLPLPLDKPLFANLPQDAIGGGYQTAIENGFINEQGGHTRFPGLVERVDLGGKAPVYLHDFDGDLIAATGNGQVTRIDRNYNKTDVTGVTVMGGRRVIFAKSDRELVMAAGGPIVRLRDQRTEMLSADAPQASSYVGFIGGFIVADELDSQRWFHDNAGQPAVWSPLDVFAADTQPDNIAALVINPFGEMSFLGPRSIEQFEQSSGGDAPFTRRHAMGEGTQAPYMALFADNAVWTVSSFREFVSVTGQTAQNASADIGLLLEGIDDWTDAWIGGHPDRQLNTLGQKFILMQMPRATNAYGTKGVTLVYDIRAKRFFSLYGWDDSRSSPVRWPGWSYWPLWDKIYVGGEGKIYELTTSSYRNGSDRQRWLVRTSHIGKSGQVRCDDLRLHIRRGFGSSTLAPSIRVRCSRDNRPFGHWVTRSLGLAGQRIPYVQFGGFGTADTFMFEFACDDDCAVDLMTAEVKVERVGH